MAVKKIARALRKALVKVFVFWVLLVATYLALGRQFFPQITYLQPQLEQWLSSQLSQPVSIGQLTGEWSRFDPVIMIEDLRIGDEFSVSSMTLVPGVLESISHGGMAFTRFEVQDFNGRLWQENGRWQLAGLRTQENSEAEAFSAAALLSLLQRQKSVQLKNTRLVVEPERYPNFELQIKDGELANYQSSNSLAAAARVNYLGVTMPISLQIEFFQDRPEQNRLFFSHGEFDFSPWLSDALPLISELNAQGEYWVDFDGTQWQQVTARQSFDRLTLTGAGQPMIIEDVKTEWFASVDQPLFVRADIKEYTLNGEVFTGSLARLTREGKGYEVRVNQGPAELVSAWLGINDASGLWTGLAPSGNVSDVAVSIQPEQPVSLSAMLSDVSIGEVQGVPSLNNLQAEVRIEGQRGLMQLKPTTTDIGLSYLFDRPLNAEITQGEFSWHMTPLRGVHLSADVDVTLISPDRMSELPLQVRWRQRVTSQVEKDQGSENFMGVNVAAQEAIDRDWLLSLMTAQPVPQYITALLEQQLQQVQLNDLSLSYLNAAGQNGLQLSAGFQQLGYQFLSDWPRVLEAQGTLQLDGLGLQVDVNDAYYDGLQLDDVSVDIDFSSSELALQVRQILSTQETLAMLSRPPIRNWTGAQLDTWAMPNGQADIVFNLQMPISSPEGLRIQVAADINSAALLLNNIDLALEDVVATVGFDSDKGLTIRGASFWHDGLPQLGSVDIPMSGELIQVSLLGQSRPQFWGQYFSDPVLSATQGTLLHETELQITDSQTRIDVASDLVGVAFDLPEPLMKTKAESWPASLAVTLFPDGEKKVEFQANDVLSGRVALSADNVPISGWLGLGTNDAKPLSDGLFVDVVTNKLDADQWWSALVAARQLYSIGDGTSRNSAKGLVSQSSLADQIKGIQIVAGELHYFSMPWQQVNANISRSTAAWNVRVDSASLDGSVLINDNNEVIDVDIDRLDIEREVAQDKDVVVTEPLDPLASVLPSDLPSLDVSIASLRLNQQDLGQWRFKVRVNEGVLTLSDWVAQFPEAQLQGSLVWQPLADGPGTETLFSGRVELQNALNLLTEWQYPPVLSSRDGWFEVDFNWRGSPAFFDLKRVRGAVQLELNQGAVLQVEAYEGVKLIGLLNFSRLFQRLALDFSDLLGEGLSFDQLSGEFLFDRGFARVGEPLIIDGPATKFRFNGDADLHADNIDVDMLLTIPLSSTFPLVALLAGVSPQAAAAIFVTERVFNDQLERLSSVRMSITGSFAEPEMRFYQLDENN